MDGALLLHVQTVTWVTASRDVQSTNVMTLTCVASPAAEIHRNVLSRQAIFLVSAGAGVMHGDHNSPSPTTSPSQQAKHPSHN